MIDHGGGCAHALAGSAAERDFTTRQHARMSLIPPGAVPIARQRPDRYATAFGFGVALPHPTVPDEDVVLAALTDERLGRLVLDRGESPMMAIAPTGAGKGVNIVIPTLLAWRGPSITLDPKGEAAQVVAAQLVRSGIQVVTIDPFDETDQILIDGRPLARGRLNPMQTLDAASPTFEADVLDFVTALVGGRRWATVSGTTWGWS